MATRREFLKLAGAAGAVAAVGVPAVAEGTPKRVRFPDLRNFNHKYTGFCLGSARTYRGPLTDNDDGSVNREQIDEVRIETVRSVFDIAHRRLREVKHRPIVGLPIYLNHREDGPPVGYIIHLGFVTKQTAGFSFLTGPEANIHHWVPPGKFAMIQVNIQSHRDDLHTGDWFISPALQYNQGVSDDHTPPPMDVPSWGLFQNNPRWMAHPLTRLG